MAHTPGPWHISKETLTAINSEKKHIAMVNYWKSGNDADIYGEEHEANARLIAAAPDMLKTLKWVGMFIETLAFDDDVIWDDVLYQIQQAIAKAEGRKT